MIIPEQIEQLKNTIVTIEQPEQIILFGSYAYGEPEQESDIDILVVKEYDAPRHKRGKEVLKVLSYVRFPLDIVFYTPDEIKKWRHTPLAFITIVMSKRKVIYERQQRTDGRMVQEGGATRAD